MGHIVEVCLYCKVVFAQYKMEGRDKTNYSICEKCKQKEKGSKSEMRRLEHQKEINRDEAAKAAKGSAKAKDGLLSCPF